MRTKEQEQVVVDFKEFIKGLIFEDAGIVLDKTYRWLRAKPVDGFNIDVDMRGKSIGNVLIRFSKDDSLAFTLFEGK